ncbi:hypothetical protein [Halomonas sp. 707B3]|uniref:hypothetical protein n=1 Tax=Halomonas sp. 707B3 TaxID=1681043 RepID=UPI00209CF4E4|nr:hypothetical protein [Halomonas sp. 707B3]MCP1316414.1 hypothetical protein [Halomonas sp. 707B3]
MANQYAERDIMALDKHGGHYTRHLSAMTGEALHDKSDIAAELAWRDAEIARLERERDAYRTAEEHQIALRQKIEQERDALAADRADLIQELIPLQNMTHGLARSGGCSPDYPNDAKAVLERVTGGHAPFFDDSGPSAKCLSRRDALKQAEWISDYLRSLHWNTMSISPIDLNIEAKRLRRQAEAQQ